MTMAKDTKQKFTKLPNPLEALKDIGKSTARQMKSEVAKLPEDFIEQLFGVRPQPRNFSGEIMAGETIEIDKVLSGEQENLTKQKRQVEFLLRLEREEREQLEKKSNELRIQISAIQQEILKTAQQTENLAQETVVAAMQAPVDPGEYHVIFFEKLLEFIRSFRKKIEEAGVWLNELNKRVAKKNAWGVAYKKYGAKYLLSGEHYLQRSAG